MQQAHEVERSWLREFSRRWRWQPRKKRRWSSKRLLAALEATLLSNLGADRFTLKLGSFGKFSVQHKPGILRKIPFTGETILTKDRRKVTFVSLGNLNRSRPHIRGRGCQSGLL